MESASPARKLYLWAIILEENAQLWLKRRRLYVCATADKTLQMGPAAHSRAVRPLRMAPARPPSNMPAGPPTAPTAAPVCAPDRAPPAPVAAPPTAPTVLPILAVCRRWMLVEWQPLYYPLIIYFALF